MSSCPDPWSDTENLSDLERLAPQESEDGSGSQPCGDDSQDMSAAMNLQEYEARFVHRSMRSFHQVSLDSSDTSMRFHDADAQDISHEYSRAVSLDVVTHTPSTAQDRGAVRVESVHSPPAEDATLLDMRTGQPMMTEDAAVAKIRGEIAAAQAQAHEKAVAAAEAEAAMECMGGEAESTRDGWEEGDTTMSIASETTRFAETDNPQRRRQNHSHTDTHFGGGVISITARVGQREQARGGKELETAIESARLHSKRVGEGHSEERQDASGVQRQLLESSGVCECVCACLCLCL